MTRTLCNMQLVSPCQLAEVEFTVVAEHISTRDLVQEYLAYKTLPTSSGWTLPKKKGIIMNVYDFHTVLNFRKASGNPIPNG
jgi:hypothetical protein